MAFELPPRLRLEQERRAEKQPKTSNSGSGPMKKGQPWTSEEHLQFLAGLKKLGRSNWRGISRYFVPTRTPTQVASHAQKHFLRTSGVCKRRSRFAQLEQAASAQGLLGHDVQSLTTMSSALPVFYGMPAYGASSSEKPSLDSSAASDPGAAGLQVEKPGSSISCPESFPSPFPKICRPIPYHASARLTDMAKLRADLAASATDSTLQPLQPSSRSAFFPVHPTPAISA
ncbi:g10916 [Coccomyxa viridis]|uniref:G10916 protein n=1 Tax=Coccomyxa viridis TaxID=1274662 RepID=A0ABP1GAT4_9CHLO